MRPTVLRKMCGLALTVAVASGAENAPPKQAPVKGAQSDAAGEPVVEHASDERHAADEKVLKKLADDFANAFNAGDAKAIASQFAPQAEMVDLDGNVLRGRGAIEEFYAATFREPRLNVAVEIESLRFVGDDLAIEDGHLKFFNADREPILRSRYTAVHTRDDGKWLIASSRDVVNPNDRLPPHEHLKQLAWLVGDWVEESGDSLVSTSCKWDESQNFLLCEYAVKVGGRTTMSGAQRIGWDPLARQIKTWSFDSDGGYGEGYWRRDGDRWLLKLTGVAADGRSGSATQIHTRQNDHTRTWSAVDRLLGGEPLPDIEKITVVRAPHPPLPPVKKGE